MDQGQTWLFSQELKRIAPTICKISGRGPQQFYLIPLSGKSRMESTARLTKTFVQDRVHYNSISISGRRARQKHLGWIMFLKR